MLCSILSVAPCLWALSFRSGGQGAGMSCGGLSLHLPSGGLLWAPGLCHWRLNRHTASPGLSAAGSEPARLILSGEKGIFAHGGGVPPNLHKMRPIEHRDVGSAATPRCHGGCEAWTLGRRLTHRELCLLPARGALGAVDVCRAADCFPQEEPALSGLWRAARVRHALP